MRLYGADGRPIRRAVGFLRDYVAYDGPANDAETADAIAAVTEIEVEQHEAIEQMHRLENWQR